MNETNEYDVVIYKITGIVKTKVQAQNFSDAREQTDKIAKENKFKKHNEFRMVLDMKV